MIGTFLLDEECYINVSAKFADLVFIIEWLGLRMARISGDWFRIPARAKICWRKIEACRMRRPRI